MKTALMSAFTISTERKPKARMTGAAVAFMRSEPAAAAKVSMPDWNGVRPKLSCSMSGKRKGMAPTPIRKNEAPRTPALKV